MMRFQIRPYCDGDYTEIRSWWDDVGVPGPERGEMVPDGTFVLEIEGQSCMSLTVLMTQSKSISYLEGYVARPDLLPDDQNAGAQLLWGHCLRFARDRGYSNVFIYAGHPKLVDRYEELGMTRSISGLTVLHRRVS